MALTERLNLQADIHYRESEEGDLAFNFDPDNFLKNKTVDREQSSMRLGLRSSPAGNSSFLLSYIHNDNNESLKQSEQIDPFTIFSIDTDVDDKGDQSVEVSTSIRAMDSISLPVLPTARQTERYVTTCSSRMSILGPYSLFRRLPNKT